MRRRLRLRGRLTVLCAGIVGLVLVLGSVAAYVGVRNALRGQIDDQLQGQRAFFLHSPRFVVKGGGPLPNVTRLGAPSTVRGGALDVRPGVRAGGPVDLAQSLTRAGKVDLRSQGEDVRIPVTAADKAIAAGRRRALLADRTVSGVHLRVITFPTGEGALQFARPLSSADSVLTDLRLVLALLVVLGTAAAALLARVFSRPALEPVTELTEAAEHIEATGDLGRRIDPRSDDEVGRMASSFNAMLDRVQDSVDAQRQLVADASHELRTPVSALRTNVEVLSEAGDALDVGQRRQILDDVVAQADELGELVGDLIELARGEDLVTSSAASEDVRLDALIAESVERARRHAPGVRFTTALVPVVMTGAPDRLARAINNLLDNAAKHGGLDGAVEVGLAVTGADALVTVRDHGPGVPAEEAEHIFDRFTRGSRSRESAGSGLGLAIVRQVAHAHAGSVTVEQADGGGARFVLSLPASAVAGA